MTLSYCFSMLSLRN